MTLILLKKAINNCNLVTIVINNHGINNSITDIVIYVIYNTNNSHQ